MKSNYLVAPLIGLAAFAGYYIYWKSQPQAPRQIEAKVDPYAHRDGRKEAEALVAAGKLAFIESGAKVSWDPERHEIAQAKYGVDLRRFDDDTTEASARYIDAFNRVMRPRILARHGRGFFDTLHQEAIALHESRTGKKG